MHLQGSSTLRRCGCWNSPHNRAQGRQEPGGPAPRAVYGNCRPLVVASGRAATTGRGERGKGRRMGVQDGGMRVGRRGRKERRREKGRRREKAGGGAAGLRLWKGPGGTQNPRRPTGRPLVHLLPLGDPRKEPALVAQPLSRLRGLASSGVKLAGSTPEWPAGIWPSREGSGRQRPRQLAAPSSTPPAPPLPWAAGCGRERKGPGPSSFWGWGFPPASLAAEGMARAGSGPRRIRAPHPAGWGWGFRKGRVSETCPGPLPRTQNPEGLS